MKKWFVITLLVSLLLATAPVQAGGAIGVGYDTVTFYPMGLYNLGNGFAVGAEIYPGLSYLGVIGRYYQNRDLSGPYAGVVLGSVSSDKTAPYGLSVFRLQGGYGLRLERNGRVVIGVTHDTIGVAGISDTGLYGELQYVF